MVEDEDWGREREWMIEWVPYIHIPLLSSYKFQAIFEAEAAKKSEAAGGLLFTDSELGELNQLAESIGHTPLSPIGQA